MALAFAWPLPAHLWTHLPGPPAGDTGVYVWNQWIFRHELVEQHTLPYFTDRIFAGTARADLSLHNYTTFQNLLALVLIPWLGIVASYNAIYLLMSVVTAYATFLLARQVTGGRLLESWLAGILFAWSPLMFTRGTDHVSLIAAAPLAVFLLVLVRADGHERFRDAVALGVVVWWAASTDVYYAVYCLLLGAIYVVARVVSIAPGPRAGHGRALLWGLDVALLCLAGLITALAVGRSWEFTVLGVHTRVRGLHTPVLAFTILGLMRLGWRYRASVVSLTRTDVWRFARLTAATGLVAAVLMSPLLYAVGRRIADGRFQPQTVYWRSSPAGTDVMAFLLPNPNHPWAPAWMSEWLAARPGGYHENVASLSFVMLVVLVAAWRNGWRASRWWLGITSVFGLLALGPFVQMAGINTYMPGPWALLRYVPIVGLARTPPRFGVVMMLGLAVLFATALAWLAKKHPRKRVALLAGTAVLLVFELLPAPITLHSAAIPSIYRIVADSTSTGAVLELPFGIKDGTSNAGSFTARTLFFQTAHGKPILGGYLSRVGRRRFAALQGNDVLNALVLLSEGKALPLQRQHKLVADGPALVRDRDVAFVVIDRARASTELIRLATEAFRLRFVAADFQFELYVPTPVGARGAIDP